MVCYLNSNHVNCLYLCFTFLFPFLTYVVSSSFQVRLHSVFNLVFRFISMFSMLLPLLCGCVSCMFLFCCFCSLPWLLCGHHEHTSRMKEVLVCFVLLKRNRCRTQERSKVWACIHTRIRKWQFQELLPEGQLEPRETNLTKKVGGVAMRRNFEKQHQVLEQWSHQKNAKGYAWMGSTYRDKSIWTTL